jgi:hypothetical protein
MGRFPISGLLRGIARAQGFRARIEPPEIGKRPNFSLCLARFQRGNEVVHVEDEAKR